MDNSWCLGLGGKRFLIDPWLEGVEVDYFSWFNTQWHRTPPLSYSELPAFDAVLITQNLLVLQMVDLKVDLLNLEQN